MRTLAQLAVQHLMLRLRPINRVLRAAVERQSAATERLSEPELSELCITPNHAGALLDEADRCLDPGQAMLHDVALLASELELEATLRTRAKALGTRLPLDALESQLQLTPFELETLLVCTAPEVDRAYGRIFAYVLDDLQRRNPCVELLALLTASSTEERLARRGLLGRFGRLRRVGLLRPLAPAASELRQELKLGAGVLELLLGQELPVSSFRDPAEVPLPGQPWLPAEVAASAVERLGGALALELIRTVGIWGGRADGQEEVVLALALAAGRPLRRLLPPPADGDAESAVQDALEAAAVTQSTLWITVDDLDGPAHERLRAALTSQLAASPVPVCLSGRFPWRPAALLEARPYAELRLPATTFNARKEMWTAHLPEISEEAARDRAARLRVGPAEVRAIGEVARAAVRLASADEPRLTVESQLDEASAIVIRKRTEHVARIIMPTRSAEDLVLAPELHRQVLEVAHFFRAWPRVSEEWGLGRLVSSSRGVKALFTGDPGTGKTLSAEVIAGTIGLPLFKVDLAQVVSKWVGETEKNLETVFKEAEESHSVLFFDEADALFGRRGEVQHGSDRYANLEVSYLLQRLEDFDGLVILASNLKDQIDAAFTRRFHVVLHFPRPREEERLRIWRATLAPGRLTDGDVDLALLGKLDLTGAGIVNATRTAALLAAQAGATSVSMIQLIEGVARQYRREARVLTPADLGGRRWGPAGSA